MSLSKKRVGIVGGSGYVGLELLRLLANHPELELAAVTSRENAGKEISAVHPALSGLLNLKFTEKLSNPEKLDLVFVAVPHTESMSVIASLVSGAPKLKIIDLGTDFRLSPQEFAKTYGQSHIAPELLERAVYGTPELSPAQIAQANLIANPGCFAHCIILALAPLAKLGLIAAPVKVTALTGSSGSGVQPTSKTHHPERNDSLAAYNVLKHRHVPEICRTLSSVSPVEIELVPISGPFSRGIFATLFVEISDPNLDVAALYAGYCGENYFLRLRSETPRLIELRGTNFCDLAVYQTGNKVVVISALDNLGKGASGNAIQCANLMFGFDEQSGLKSAPLIP